MIASPIRVMVVDDSAVVRGLLARTVEKDASLQLVGTAMHGESALTQLRRTPADVVVLDVEMPVMDGLTALQKILVEFPQTRVIMASSLTSEGAQTTCHALALGAAGCIAKPATSSLADSIDQLSRELIPLIRALGARPVEKKATPLPARIISPPPVRTRLNAPAPAAIVIGTSTGGPQALRMVLTSLPKDFPLPIFIVQHMPPLFTPMLARHLEADTGRPCREGMQHEIVQAGQTYVAPGDFHMEVERRDQSVRIRLTQAPQEHYCRPSVNPLFRSAAECYGASLIGVILTGMGEDGLEGSRTLIGCGARLIAQDEASSVVWGMPGAVVRAGLPHEVLPLDQIAPRLLKICLQEVAR